MIPALPDLRVLATLALLVSSITNPLIDRALSAGQRRSSTSLTCPASSRSHEKWWARTGEADLRTRLFMPLRRIGPGHSPVLLQSSMPLAKSVLCV